MFLILEIHKADLDEFMISKGMVYCIDEGIGHTLLPDLNERIKMMCE